MTIVAGDPFGAVAGRVDALVERYVSGDRSHLDEMISTIGRLTELAPDHADRLAWWYWLAMSHRDRGRPADLDAAASLLEQLYHAMPTDEVARDDVVIELIDTYWDRYWMHAYDDNGDSSLAPGYADRVIAGRQALVFLIDHPPRTAHVNLVVGLAHMERFQFDQAWCDVDVAISLIRQALPDARPHDPVRGLAAAELARAYRLRGERDADLGSLNHAIWVGDDAIAGATAADPWWGTLHEYQSDSYFSRAQFTGDASDFELALRHMRVRLTADGADDSDMGIVAIVVVRAFSTKQEAHLDAALASLCRVVATTDDESIRGLAWRHLADLQLEKWFMTGVGSWLDQSVHSIRHAMACDLDEEDLAAVHHSRSSIIGALTKRELAEPHGNDPSA